MPRVYSRIESGNFEPKADSALGDMDGNFVRDLIVKPARRKWVVWNYPFLTLPNGRYGELCCTAESEVLQTQKVFCASNSRICTSPLCPHTVSSSRLKCCALHECPQCGLLARHSSALVNGSLGPSVSARSGLIREDAAKRRMAAKSPQRLMLRVLRKAAFQEIMCSKTATLGKV